MTFLILALLAISAVVMTLSHRGGRSRAFDSHNMGTVSEQWLAEYRASHPSWTSVR